MWSDTAATSLGILQQIAGADHIDHINRDFNSISSQGEWLIGILVIFMVIATHVTCLAIR